MGYHIFRYQHKSAVSPYAKRFAVNTDNSQIENTMLPSEQTVMRPSAYRDALTNLYNRGFIANQASRYIEAGIHTGLIVCDIDHLKLVNDAFGHHFGDELITTTASRLKNLLKDYPLIGRVGGDEFAVLIPNGNEAEADAVTMRINSLQGTRWGEYDFPLSFSTGYAVWQKGKTIEETYREADNMMYLNKLRNSQRIHNELIHTLFNILENRVTYETGHGMRTQLLSHSLGNYMGLNPTRMENLNLAAQFHDLGKVRIPESIIKSTQKLSSLEMELIRRHSAIGYRIALLIPNLAPVADLILKHHESWDGTGYPLGLSGESIPLECRINLVADAFDAMTSDRPYRSALTQDEAMAEIAQCSGKQFDPAVVQALFAILD